MHFSWIADVTVMEILFLYISSYVKVGFAAKECITYAIFCAKSRQYGFRISFFSIQSQNGADFEPLNFTGRTFFPHNYLQWWLWDLQNPRMCLEWQTRIFCHRNHRTFIIFNRGYRRHRSWCGSIGCWSCSPKPCYPTLDKVPSLTRRILLIYY